MEHIHLKLYNPSDSYMSPSGEIMDAANVLNHFPAAQAFAHIVQTDAGGEMLFGFYNLSAMKSKYGVDQALPAEQAVQMVEDAMNAEREAAAEAAGEASPEERIAAALEFQALAALPDAEGKG